jgi:hypothetical protein
MSIKIGEFDIANQLLDNEFRIGVLEKLLEKVLNNNPALKLPTPSDLEKFRMQTAEELKKKYPHSGIEYKKN